MDELLINMDLLNPYEDQDDTGVGEIEKDIDLRNVSDEIILESIRSQIQDPSYNNANYLSQVINNYNDLFAKYAEDAAQTEVIKNNQSAFYAEIMSMISDSFNMGIDIDGIFATEDDTEAVTILYEYFIVNYKKNIRKFIKRYIDLNKDQFIATYEESAKKEITMNVFKNQTSEDNIIIYTALPMIVRDIINLNVPLEDFIDITTGEDSYYNDKLITWINQGKLISDGAYNYIYATDIDDSGLLDSIITDIKVKLTKKIEKRGE